MKASDKIRNTADETRRETSCGEYTRFWRVESELGGVELLHARYTSHRFAPHVHETYTLGVIQEGALGFDREGSRHAAPAGTISLVPPGQVHTGFAAGEAGGWSYRNFFFPPSFLRRACKEATGQIGLPDFPEPVIDDKELAEKLLQAHRVLEASPVRLEREGRLLEALALLASRHTAGTRPTSEESSAPNARPAVQRAWRRIEDCYDQDLGLDDLAATAGLSKYHFLRVFREETGLTPHAYLLNVRIRRASQKLAAGQAPAQVALACGFCDQSHLTRRFKRTYGVTPGQYASAVRR